MSRGFRRAKPVAGGEMVKGFHCGKYFEGEAAKEHFRETEQNIAQCIVDKEPEDV